MRKIKSMANDVNASFLHKNSPTLLNDLRSFMIDNFGFGDFIFRLPNNEEVSKATTVDEFIQGIESIPVDSLLFHAESITFQIGLRLEQNLGWHQNFSQSMHINLKTVNHYALIYLKDFILKIKIQKHGC